MRSIDKLELLAQIFTKGHYSIFRFSSNYRVCLGTAQELNAIADLRCEGKTLDEAVEKVINIAIEKYSHTSNDWYRMIAEDGEAFNNKHSHIGDNK